MHLSFLGKNFEIKKAAVEQIKRISRHAPHEHMGSQYFSVEQIVESVIGTVGTDVAQFKTHEP